MKEVLETDKDKQERDLSQESIIELKKCLEIFSKSNNPEDQEIMKKLFNTLQTFSSTGKVDHDVINSIIEAKNKLVSRNNNPFLPNVPNPISNPIGIINNNPNFNFGFNPNMGKLPFPIPPPLLNPITQNVNFPLFNNLNNNDKIDKFDNKKNIMNMNGLNLSNINNVMNIMNNNIRPPNYKTKPCRNFHSEVGCNREDKCHFIHDLNYAGIY